jgi:hypothetical protein
LDKKFTDIEPDKLAWFCIVGKKNQFFAEQIALAWREKYARALLSRLRTCWSSLRGKFTPERSSSGVLEARWSKFFPRKSCSWRKSWA